MSKSTSLESMRARRRAFLDALSVGGVASEAAAAAGVSRNAAYAWRDSDPAFADLWDEALATATDALEAEARRRAVEGVEAPVMHRGQVVFRRDEGGELVRDAGGAPVPMVTHVRSDRLLEFLLAGKKAEFSRRTVDLNQRVEHRPAPAAHIDFKRMSPEKRELVRQLLEMPDEAFVEAPPDGTEDAF